MRNIHDVPLRTTAEHDSATCQWCQSGEHFFAPMKHYPQAHILAPVDTKWVRFTKRTEDPKLKWLEYQLFNAGIPSRRRGHSFHAPILEVPEARLDAAWEILSPVDDIDDDDAMFEDVPPKEWRGESGWVL